jgi:serine/threonine-protein kinase
MLGLSQVVASIATLTTVGLAMLMTAFGMSVEPPSTRLKSVGGLRSRFWNSPIASWFARVLTPAKRGVPDSAFRPTELALGTAVHELFAALPTSYRQHVGDLPTVGERLMTEAAHLRSEVDRLERIRMQAPPEEMQIIDPNLAHVRTRLGTTVGALERMRLELLRLHGGTTDLRPLTTSLDLAREMVDNLVRLRESEDEVEPKKRLFAFDSRSPSPVL